MSHFTIREWEHVKLGQSGFDRSQADALHAAACAHPLANRDGTNILIYGRDRIVARQMVGMVAANGCSLEILPKVDPDAVTDEGVEAVDNVRSRLVRMLDVALGLDLGAGRSASIGTQNHSLLEILIRAFADKLLAEVRRGLPRLYRDYEDDLTALRGRLDVRRQFTHNAVRPDRLACQFDQLDVDTPLMRVMAAAVKHLGRYARSAETRRMFDELRHVLADIPQVPVMRLRWRDVRIDRTNRRWESLYRLAQLLLRRDWQATHHQSMAPEGLTLLFPMNDLFERYVAAMMRRALEGRNLEVIEQGGHLACLGSYTGEHLKHGEVFRTKPDILLRKGQCPVALVDTKWKKLATDPLDRSHGVSQADVYQLMAYARLYRVPELMLLYPERPGRPCGVRKSFGIAGGSEKLTIATVDTSLQEDVIISRLSALFPASAFPPSEGFQH